MLHIVPLGSEQAAGPVRCSRLVNQASREVVNTFVPAKRRLRWQGLSESQLPGIGPGAITQIYASNSLLHPRARSIVL